MTIVFNQNGLIITDESLESGTGNYNTFLRIQAGGNSDVEAGFSTDAKHETLIGGASGDFKFTFTNSLLASQLATVVGPGGSGSYFKFGLDVNNSNDPSLILTEFKIYQGTDPNASDQSLLGTAVFDMDSPSNTSATLPDIGAGSGKSDYSVYVPTAGFNPAQYVYVYAKFINASGGFEEFGAVKAALSPDLTIVKTIDHFTDANGDSLLDAGDVIHYNIVVTNSGGVTLTGVSVTDPLTGDPAGVVPTLAVGASETLHTTYTITAADEDAGHVLNVATADSDQTGPKDASVDTGGVIVHHGLTADVSITKVVAANGWHDVNGDHLVDATDTITYDIVVTNTGGVTLTGVSVTDPLTGAPAGQVPTLAVGASETLHTTYTLTQADIDNHGSNAVDLTLDNKITNTATVHTGQTPDHSASADQAIDYKPDVSITKTHSLDPDHFWWVDVNHDGMKDAGDTVTYNIHVENTGDVTLHNVTVTDPLTGNTFNIGTLAVGGVDNETVTYTMVQSDIDNNGNPAGGGTVINKATVTATEAGPKDASDGTPIDFRPIIEVTKTLSGYTGGTPTGHTDGSHSPIVLVGDKSGNSANSHLTWNFTVTNTGDVTLHNVTAVDAPVGTVTNLTSTVLAPTQSATGSLTENVANVTGAHNDTVTANSTLPDASTGPSDTDTGTYTGAQGDITIDKVVSNDGGLTWHDSVVSFQNLQLAYMVTVHNNSDSGLNDEMNVAVTDTQATVTGVVTTLAQNASDDSDIYHAFATGTGGTNTANVTATISDNFGNSMTVSDSDTASYTTVQGLGGLSKGYWANHSWSGTSSPNDHHAWTGISAGNNIILGDSNLSHSTAGDTYDLTFDAAGAQLMDNSSTVGDARIILGGQLVAAQMNSYYNEATAKGLVDAGAKWFWEFGLQDDNTTFTALHTGGNTGAGGLYPVSPTGGTVSNVEYGAAKNAFTFKEGAAVSTNDTAAWKGDMFHFDYVSQYDGKVHDVGVTGEGLKNALEAFDLGADGHGLWVSTDNSLIAYHSGSNNFFQYDNTANLNLVDTNHTGAGTQNFWSDLKGGAFIAVLNDAKLAGLVSLTGINDEGSHTAHV